MSTTPLLRLVTQNNQRFSSNSPAFFLQDFLDAKRVAGFSPRTLHLYKDKLTTFCAWLDDQGIQDLFEVQPRTVRAYLAHLQGKGHSAGGVWTLYRPMRTFLRWVKAEGVTDDWDPMRNVPQPRVPDDVLPPANVDDLRAMPRSCRTVRCADIRDACIIRTLLDTSMRASEFLALRLCDVDAGSGDAAIRAETAKVKRPRMAFLGVQVRRAMRRYITAREGQGAKPEDSLWANQAGEPLGYFTLREAIRRRADKMEVPCPSWLAACFGTAGTID